MSKLFTLRVGSGDVYFSFGEVLTPNVKNGENLERNLTGTGKKVPTVLCHVCSFRTDRVKIRSRTGYNRSKRVPLLC